MANFPHTDSDIKAMLQSLGLSSLEDLFKDIPPRALMKRSLQIPDAMSEGELRRKFSSFSKKNVTLTEQSSFIGAGVYRHDIPAAVKTLISRGEFATAYTPYQAEASQGTLQAIYEYQTVICRLTGMDVANASHYDGATSLAEAALMAVDLAQKETVIVSHAVHPHYREVLKTYLHGRDIALLEASLLEGTTSLAELEKSLSSNKVASVLVQYPNFFGNLEDLKKIASLCQKYKTYLVVAVNELLALGLLQAPGNLGASIVAGEGQSLGIAPSLGGPHVGFIAAKKEFLRRIPGRLVGETLDTKGNRAFTLTLQTREQHIRREKAASNLCTNQSLCALANLIYLSLLGKHGLKQLSAHCYHKAHYAFREWTKLDRATPVFPSPFYNEFLLQLSIPVSAFMNEMKNENILAGYPIEKDYPEYPNCILLTLTEMNSREEIDHFTLKLSNILNGKKVGCA